MHTKTRIPWTSLKSNGGAPFDVREENSAIYIKPFVDLILGTANGTAIQRARGIPLFAEWTERFFIVEFGSAECAWTEPHNRFTPM
jgi:hypothetical protein